MALLTLLHINTVCDPTARKPASMASTIIEQISAYSTEVAARDPLARFLR